MSARTRTDIDGRFGFDDLARGRYTLSIRAIGFTPVRRVVAVEEGDTTAVTVAMVRVAVTLDSLAVRASPPAEARKLASFYRRQSKGFGRFIEQAALQAAEHSTLSDFFAKIGGLRLIRRPQRCGGGFALASGRGPPVSSAEWMACFGGSPRDPTTAFPPACYLTIYIDGLRVWAWGGNEPPDLNNHTIVSLQAIEIYRGPAELPSELQATGSSCGAVVLWTK